MGYVLLAIALLIAGGAVALGLLVAHFVPVIILQVIGTVVITAIPVVLITLWLLMQYAEAFAS